MKTYNPKANCIKCGKNNIAIEYYPAGNYAFSKEIYNEHLRLTCNVCGYDWEEKPLDAEGISDTEELTDKEKLLDVLEEIGIPYESVNKTVCDIILVHSAGIIPFNKDGKFIKELFED